MARKLIWEHDEDSVFATLDAALLSVMRNAPKAAVIPGTSGRDTIHGTANADTISGGEAGDTLFGGGGNDAIYGFGPSDRTQSGGLIDATLVASGLDNCLFAGSPPGDPNRLFIVEQHTGQIKILDLNTSTVLPTPFLDIDGIAGGNEQGFLGMAFHPDYEANGKYYVFTNRASDGDIEVWEYTRGPNPDVSSTTRELVIRIDHSDAGNHNGGWMGFGPDGYLYIAVGDGGGGGDANNDAQNINSLLGKILRIDVNGDDFASTSRNYAIPDDNPFVGVDGADEVFAYGLRNPWRLSFDPETGDFYFGDVGQNAWEEVNYIPAGELSGANFGWHILEGNHIYDDDTPGNPDPDDPSLVDPIFEYNHNSGPFGGFAVTGGYVIRGPDAGGQGLYIFADFATDNIWTLAARDGGYTALVRRNDQIVVDDGDLDSIASFAVDGSGRIYVIGLDGEIHRLTFNDGAGDAHDTIDGGAGDDRLWGGWGDDTLIGGQGADTLRGGGGADTARYTGSTVGVVVMLDGSTGAGGDAQGDVFFGIENLIGSSRNDQLTGSNGANALNGAEGNDVLRGGAGADALLGSGGVDTASYVGAATGVTVNLVSHTGDGGDAEGDTLRLIENVTGGSGNDTLIGDVGANRLDGGEGSDELRGGNGADRLNGGAGIDTLVGAGASDILNGGGGQDILTGGAASDAFLFNAALLVGNADTITDFGNGDDVIQLSQAVFTGLALGALAASAFRVGASAADADDRIIYDASTGALYFDADGAGAQAQVRFATLTGAPSLTVQDFLVV